MTGQVFIWARSASHYTPCYNNPGTTISIYRWHSLSLSVSLNVNPAHAMFAAKLLGIQLDF